MKITTIAAILLLMSFGMAEEASQSVDKSSPASFQETQQEAPKKLQDLGKGYAKDPETNQIYYEGKEVLYVYSPKTFKVISSEDENGYDAEDHYQYYKRGWRSKKNIEISAFSPYYYGYFDVELNIPMKCFDYKEDAEELLQCYQKYVYPEKWPTNPPMDPKSFKILNIKEKMTKNLWDVWAVADQYRIILFTSLYNSKEVFVLDNISDFTSFMLIGEHRNNLIPYGDFTDAIFLYFKDKNYVYSNLGIIEGADPMTFEILEYPYTKDKNHVYYKGEILKDAVSSEFALLDYRLRLARDATKIFYKNAILDGLDLKTFKMINSPYPLKQIYWDSTDFGADSEFTICPIAVLMDEEKLYYLDMFLLLQLEKAITLSINGDHKKFLLNQNNGLIPIPSPLNYKDIEIIYTSPNFCKNSSFIFLKSNNTIFSLYRKDASLFLHKMEEIDADSFEVTPELWIIDKNHTYRLDKNGMLEIQRQGVY